MSSAAFQARTTHTSNDPQICGLHKATGCVDHIELEPGDGPEEVRGAIVADQLCFYLTCRGNEAKPSLQIQGSNKKDGYSTGYRSIPSGRTREVGKCRAGHTSRSECADHACGQGRWYDKKIYKWQEQSTDGRWHDVEVWERMVHHDCAIKAGYVAPSGRTKAHRGARTVGYAHRVKADAISPLEEMAAAVWEEDQADEAAGS